MGARGACMQGGWGSACGSWRAGRRQRRRRVMRQRRRVCGGGGQLPDEPAGALPQRPLRPGRRVLGRRSGRRLSPPHPAATLRSPLPGRGPRCSRPVRRADARVLRATAVRCSPQSVARSMVWWARGRGATLPHPGPCPLSPRSVAGRARRPRAQWPRDVAETAGAGCGPAGPREDGRRQAAPSAAARALGRAAGPCTVSQAGARGGADPRPKAKTRRGPALSPACVALQRRRHAARFPGPLPRPLPPP